jgi:hypothetical protein
MCPDYLFTQFSSGENDAAGVYRLPGLIASGMSATTQRRKYGEGCRMLGQSQPLRRERDSLRPLNSGKKKL